MPHLGAVLEPRRLRRAAAGLGQRAQPVGNGRGGGTRSATAAVAQGRCVYDGTSARHPPAPVHRVARRVGGAALWVTAAATLSYTLRTAGNLVLLYGSFAGVGATLVFLYLGATMPIFGAEINGVLREKTST